MRTISDNFQKNILLSSQTTFRIGGPAKYFLAASSKKEIVEAINWAKENNLPFFILGGGSNILFSDKGFSGLIIKPQFLGLEFKKEKGSLLAEVGASVSLAEVVSESINSDFSGLEWALGIPGTLGGAICGNAGRLGQDISQVIRRVKILNENLIEEEILVSECDFSYRSSRFKQRPEIILSAVLQFNPLEKNKSEELLNQAQRIVEKMPDWPSAGSVFKNYLVGESDILTKENPEFKEKIKGGKLPAGALIEQCGLLGKRIGGAKIWEQHGNFILNINNAKATEVLELIELCKESVKEKFGVALEEEIRKIGF